MNYGYKIDFYCLLYVWKLATVKYLNDSRVDSAVGMPEAAIITPLPGDGICLGLRTDSFQQSIYGEDAVPW